MINKWSHHSIQRIQESPIKLKFAKKLLRRSQTEQLSSLKQMQKFEKYGIRSLDNEYKYVHLDLVYTVNKVTGEVITFTVVDKNNNQIVTSVGNYYDD